MSRLSSFMERMQAGERIRPKFPQDFNDRVNFSKYIIEQPNKIGFSAQVTDSGKIEANNGHAILTMTVIEAQMFARWIHVILED